MLVERTSTTSSFKIGDTVMVKTTKQVGTVTAIKGDRYTIRVGTTELTFETAEISPRKILLG